MDGQFLRILAQLADAGPHALGRRLCASSVQVLAVAGASVGVHDSVQPVLCASNELAGRIEDLQFMLGEGPGIDAHRSGEPVAEPDLGRPRSVRWPGFAPPALSAGVAAVFSFPLRVGAVRIGALTLHQDRSGPLSDDQHADALTMASIVVNAVLASQADAPPGALAGELEALGASRAEVHQASGMVSVQLGISVAEALVRLRAHAYAERLPLATVAGEVIRRRLRLSP